MWAEFAEFRHTLAYLRGFLVCALKPAHYRSLPFGRLN